MSHFFAYLSRMKLIRRWGLMRNIQSENIQEHSLRVAMIAHGLAVIKNKKFEGNLNSERVALLAMFHDANEVITGDLPTPIKYFNPEIKNSYKAIENVANKKLFDMLPAELTEDYDDVFFKKEKDAELWLLIKAADKICAYIKCMEEISAGNLEFKKAEQVLRASIREFNLPEVDYFLEIYLPSFLLTLDELG